MRAYQGIATIIAAIWSAGAQSQTAPANGQSAQARGDALDKSPPATAASVTSQDDGSVADIVVTAQRRSEALSRSAIAASAVTGNALLTQNATTVSSLTRLVPSLQIAQGAGPYNVFSIRGVVNVNANGLSDATVAFNYDGVYISRSTSTSGLFYDLQRVEVLKGPQGILYGRNATAGAINVLPAPPTFTTGGYVSGSIGNYDAKNAEGALNVRISENVAVRGSFQLIDRDGFFSDGRGDEVSQSGRLQLLYKPIDSLSVKIAGDYSHTGGQGNGSTILGQLDKNKYIGLHDPRAASVFTRSFFVAAPIGAFAPVRIPFSPLPGGDFADNEFWGIHATLDWATDLGTLTILPAYREGSLDFQTTVSGYAINFKEEDRQHSIEARFASNDDRPLRWLLGAYYLNETIDSHPIYNQAAGLQSLIQNLDIKTRSFSGFGQLTWALTDTFRLVGGARYTNDRKQAIGDSTSRRTLTVAPGVTAPVTTSFQLNGAATFERTTWKAGVEWDVRPQSLLYATVSTGFKAGGFFFSPVAPLFQPERIIAYTLGSKSRFLDGKLTANLEAYYWKYSDQQVSFLGPIAPGVIGLPTRNIGQATIKGVEIDLQYRPVRTTLLGAQVQYTDARYDNFVYRAPNLGAAPRTGCLSTPTATDFIVDCSGRTPPQAPKWTVVISGEQTIPLKNDFRFILGARTRYESARVLSFEYLPTYVAGSNTVTDLTVTLAGPNDKWSVGAFVNNVENKGVYNFANASPAPLAPTQLDFVGLRPPRTYGLRVRTSF
jgi:iron complex outermembrane receptor protein